MYEKGKLVEQETEQYYDEKAQKFLADRYIKGTCPKCANPNAFGDQCERCGSDLTPTELINPVSVLTGLAPVLKKTTNWFLPMDEMQADIDAFIESNKDWKPTVYGQCKSWINDGLRPRAMTRDLDWGVEVPLQNGKGKVLYVWFDAPIGYVSATKQWALDNGKDWELYWKDKETSLIHFIGKDNIVFHCITFPLMLMAHGDFILPDNVPANEFMNLEGDKMSTSRHWSIEMHEYLQDFPNKQDELRFYLTSILPETKDSEFTWKDFQARVNNELVAILGNFVNRTVVLTHKFFNGIIPEADQYTKEDILLMEEVCKMPDKIATAIEAFKFREALAELMNLARIGNKFLAETEPWKLIKTEPQRVNVIINLCLQICQNLSIVMEPFLPFTAKKMTQMLGSEQQEWNKASQLINLKSGEKINEGFLLFQKVEDTTIELQVLKLINKKKSNETTDAKIAEPKPEISFDDFQKMDIRVGKIVEAQKVPKTDKLLHLKIDTGIDTRTVVSGIAAFYEPEKIVGQKVIILVNLAPRKIKGIESHGMILMAENPKGELSFVSPTKQETEEGSAVK
jgi:methionyl-tRNA synthetase